MSTRVKYALSDEDRAAVDRLHAALVALFPKRQPSVSVFRLGDGYIARAHASDAHGSRKLESVATAKTPGEALCEAARQIGVTL